MKYASWEGARYTLVTVKNGKVIYTPLGFGTDMDKIKAMSMKYPIGIMVKNLYDHNRKVLTNTDAMVFYKGKPVEILGARELDHPHIRMIEMDMAMRDEDDIQNQYLPGMTYEKGISPEQALFTRAKKSSRAKPKRKTCPCKKK